MKNKLVILAWSETIYLEPTFIYHLKSKTLDHFPKDDFDFIVNVTFFMINQQLKLLDIIDWINENLNSSVWLRYSLGFGFRFLFYDKADALYFKLIWAVYINEKP